MARLLLLVSGAAAGYFAEDALAAHERFSAAGLDVVVATPDGEPPAIDPVSLDPVFHQFEEDVDFLAATIRSFAPDPEDVRVTLAQRSSLDLVAARRIGEELRRAGWPPDVARRSVESFARTAWRQHRNLVDLLAADEAVTAAVPADELRRLGTELRRDGSREAAATAERLASIPAFQKPARLGDLPGEELGGFAGVFVPGGGGPPADLAAHPDAGRLLRCLHAGGRVIATVSQGAAVLLSAGGRADGTWLFDGFRLVGLTNDEQDQLPVEAGSPRWSVEDGLKNAGGLFTPAAAWTSHLVVDRNLITGQNPMAAGAAVDAVLKHLARYEPTAYPPAASGFAAPPGTSERVAAPVTLVRLFFDRLDRHDLDGALALVDPAAAVDLLPLRLKGTAGVEGRAFLETLVWAFPDLRVRSRNVFAGPDGTVIAEIVVEGNQAADFFGILNQRKHVDIRQAWVLTVAGGQVQSLRAYWCQNQLYRRLGVRRLDGVR